MPLTKKAAAKYGKTVAGKLCRCIGAVKRGFKTRDRKGSAGANEQRAIAICVSAVLQKKRGRTLKKFSCSGTKPTLVTQKLLKGEAKRGSKKAL
jgi:hypothetical protein